MLATARRGISYPNPDRSDRPDVPTHIGNLAAPLDLDVIYTQGTDAARLAAAHQSGGGLFWWTTDTLIMWYDDGAAWHQVTHTGITKLWDSVEAGVTFPTSSITTPTLDQSFKHLRIVWSLKVTTPGSLASLYMRINGITTASNNLQAMYASASSVLASEAFNQTALILGEIPIGNAGNEGIGQAEIPDYSRAVVKSLVSKYTAAYNNQTGTLRVGSYSSWYSAGSPAITTLTFLPSVNTFSDGRITVYGES